MAQHASKYCPRIYPVNGDGAPVEMDRVQSIDITTDLNRRKVEEIGNPNVVGYVKKAPTVGYRMTALEYGSLESWRKITNKSDSVDTLTLDDFKTPTFDIASFLTDDVNDIYKGTLWYPKLRPSGFSFNIADPDDEGERGFDLVGEEAVEWQGDNKYVIFVAHDAPVGNETTVDLSARVPAIDPDVSVGKSDAEKYIYRVMRYRSGVSTELDLSSDVTYDTGTKVLTIVDVDAGDKFKVWHTSATAPATLFTPNTTDPAAISADSMSIYLYIPGSGKPNSTDYIYRLQSVTLDVTFDREDLKEIGNKRVVQRGINEKTVSVTLGQIMEGFTVEEVVRGEVAGYGKLDVEKLTDNASLIVKIFEDNTKSTLKCGFKADGLSPTNLSNSAGVNAYVNKENAIEGNQLTISNQNSELGGI